MKIIDLSLTLDNECQTCNVPWHTKVSVERLGTIEEVGRNTSRFVLGSHSATHMDAPSHFFEGAKNIDQVDLDCCIGEVTCIDMRHKKEKDIVMLADVKDLQITQRMLFVFGWDQWWKTSKYYENMPYFEQEAIEYLVAHGMRFMAMDTPSPDTTAAIGKKDDSPNHKFLLSKEVVIVEYLTNTSEIDFKKKHEIIALPLKLQGADGSPARVILKEENEDR